MSESLATIIVPKSGIETGKGRNNIGDLLATANYDIRGKFERRDQVQQGNLTFLAVKGADALATQLERLKGRPYALLMGSDVLAEADLTAKRSGVSSRIQRVLTIGAGPCTLSFLAPEESRVESADDLEGRRIFSKYPAVLSKALSAMGVRAQVRRTEGADTRVNEWREEDPNIAALEIVGSGDTARANQLQIVTKEDLVYPEGMAMGLDYFKFDAIATDLFASNVRDLSWQARGAIRELGLGLEAALTSHRYVAFKFNVPRSEAQNFKDLGMKGPTVSPVLSRNGTEEWCSMEIYVAEPDQNRMRAVLMQRGARDLSNAPLQLEVDASSSEVLNRLPFIAPTTISAPEAVDEFNDEETSLWLKSLADTIAGRSMDTEGKTSTGRALNMGTELCAPRYVGEALELSKAVRSGTRDEIVAEAGQCVYWFLVALQSGGVSFKEVMQRIAQVEESPDMDMSKLIAEGIQASRNGAADFSVVGGTEAATDYAEQTTEFSTALRKTRGEAALNEAVKTFQSLLALIEREVTLKEVMEKERGPKK